MRFFVFILLGALIAAPARADWQFTHWGMTPQELVASAGPTIRGIPAASASSSPAPAALFEMPYRSEKFSFLAQFCFTPDDKLFQVRLILLDGTPLDLRDNLAEKYGMPGQAQFPALYSLGASWKTATDEITLLTDSMPPHTIVPWGAHAVVNYKKRLDAGL